MNCQVTYPIRIAKGDRTAEIEDRLQELLDLGVKEHIEKVQEISLVATKQYALEKALEGMIEEWTKVKFQLVPYKDTGVSIVLGTKNGF